MSSPQPLELETLQEAVRNATAFRCRSRWQPAGGPGDKVFPPTYEGGKYATELRVLPRPTADDPDKKETVPCVLLDSVASQANRMELALLDAVEEGLITLPVIAVDFSQVEGLREIGRNFRVTTFEAPHRLADAILRDSRLADGTLFMRSDYAAAWSAARLHNATAIFELCPHALVFGVWGSPEKPGGLGAKFQRAIVSEMIGVGYELGVKVSSRLDPLGIEKLDETPIYEPATDEDLSWTTDPNKAKVEKKQPKKKGDGRPSEINHGNVTPSLGKLERVDDRLLPVAGGVTFEYAEQTTVLSLAVLRRLRFPLDGESRAKAEINEAARTVLAAIALTGAALMQRDGGSLRSRCELTVDVPPVWELLGEPGSEPDRFVLTPQAALGLLDKAIAAAKGVGLPWMEQELTLTPSDELALLVRRSQEHQIAADTEGD